MSQSPQTIASTFAEDAPFRAELLGADRLVSVAQALADTQRWTAERSRAKTPLLAMLDGAERELAAFYRTLTTDVREDIPIARPMRSA